VVVEPKNPEWLKFVSHPLSAEGVGVVKEHALCWVLWRQRPRTPLLAHGRPEQGEEERQCATDDN
jgi:hypothetical protein